jgi:threonine dehydrogenase-like Zn-dependent dehydrogenase
LQLVTHRVGLDRYAEALELLAAPAGEPRGKILIDMNGAFP